MGATRNALGMPVIALKRPHHEVDLLSVALRNDCALVLSEQTSKSFICYQIVSEYLQSERKKWAVVVMVDDNSELEVPPLIEMFNRLLPKKPLVFPNSNEAASLPHSQNVLLISMDTFKQCLTKRYMHARNISVVILLGTLKTLTIDHGRILQTLAKESEKPRIIGLVAMSLHDVQHASQLKAELLHLEAIYCLPVLMSTDVLAMNAYGDEIVVETVFYGPENLNPIERTIWEHLDEISDFLQSMKVKKVFKCIEKIRAVVVWGVEVLTVFGLWSFDSIVERILNTLSAMLSKENNALVRLAIEACKTQFMCVEKLINSQSSEPHVHSRLMCDIFDKLAPYKALCKTNTNKQRVETGEFESDADLPSEEKTCVSGIETKPGARFIKDTMGENVLVPSRNYASMSKPPVLEKKKLGDRSQFFCIIVTRSNSFAKILSKLINYTSVCNKNYSFMKSGCVIQSANETSEEVERTENVLQAVLQGMINIIVTTRDLLTDLSLTTCNLLVYFDKPSGYEDYYRVKHKIRGIAPKLVLVFSRDSFAEMKRKLQVLRDVESEIGKRISDYTTLKNKEEWLKCLAEEPSCTYQPIGENGPSISMESSVHIVNRYCHQVSKRDFCGFNGHFMTKTEYLKKKCVEFVSTLYLPLSSSSCSVVEGPPVKVSKRNALALQVGKLKSRLLASLECVKILHGCGKLDDDLDLTEEVYVDTNTCDNVDNSTVEMEDKYVGKAGTNKRKRVYQIEMPSFYENNMPQANEPCFLYKIEFDDPTIYKHSKSGSLQSLSEPEFQLGILSRKPLPKLPSFQVHTCKSDVSVRVNARNSVKIDESMLRNVRLFHYYVFKELHKLDSQFAVSKTDGYLVVPLMETSTSPNASRHVFQIHCGFLREFSNFAQTCTDSDEKLNLRPSYSDFSFFQGKIVRSRYTRYFVTKVCEDLSPSSAFPDHEVAATYAEYYENRYGIQVDPKQPLLLVKHLPAQTNFLVPRHRNQMATENVESNLKGMKNEIHLIPELVTVLPFSASAWSLTRFFPSVVHRLEAMLRAHQMKLMILYGCGISKKAKFQAKFRGERGKCSSGQSCSRADGSVVTDHQCGHHDDHDNLVNDNVGSSLGGADNHNKPCGSINISVGGHGNQNSSVYDGDNDDQDSSVHDQIDRYTGDQGSSVDDHIDRYTDYLGSSVIHSFDDQNRSPTYYDQYISVNEYDADQDNFGDDYEGDDELDSSVVGHIDHDYDADSSVSDYIGDDAKDISLNKQFIFYDDCVCSDDDVGPSISLTLHALTAKSVGQHFHSEQLELLGDSYLKLEVSLDIFLSGLNRDERIMTLHRTQLVSNDMLSKQGRRLGIPGYISITPPDLTNTSLPPGFITGLPGEVNKAFLNQYTHQVLGDKHVANTVEALIAATLIGCGRSAARKYLLWLGVARYTSCELYFLYQRLQAKSPQHYINCVMNEEREKMTGEKEKQEEKENLSNSTRLCHACKDFYGESHLMGVGGNVFEAINEGRQKTTKINSWLCNVQDTKLRELSVEKLQTAYLSCSLNVHEDLDKSIKSGKLDEKPHKETQTSYFSSLERKTMLNDGFEQVDECEVDVTLDVINVARTDLCGPCQLIAKTPYCKPGIYGKLGDCGIVLENGEVSNGKSGLISRNVLPLTDKWLTEPVPKFDHIEAELGYSFKNKRLLLQALTHNSYPSFLSQVSETYQKMEFVGDAILDYLVTLYLYENFPNLNHGDLTDFRSALVNNFTLAFLAVQKNLHQSLKYMSPKLFEVINRFLKFLEEQGASWKTSIDAFVVGASEVDDSLIEVPKVLGDVFEAVICAVFFDAAMDLELVWNVFRPMFKPFIDYYKDNIPRSPIRLLKECFAEGEVTFSLARLTLSRKYKSCVSVQGYGTFEAVGRTSKIAKASAARKAMQHIRNEGMTLL